MREVRTLKVGSLEIGEKMTAGKNCTTKIGVAEIVNAVVAVKVTEYTLA